MYDGSIYAVSRALQILEAGAWRQTDHTLPRGVQSVNCLPQDEAHILEGKAFILLGLRHIYLLPI